MFARRETQTQKRRSFTSYERDKRFIKLAIKDFGKGFDDKKQSGGNGLRNMKMRAEKLKANFLISDKNGVTIELSLKIVG